MKHLLIATSLMISVHIVASEKQLLPTYDNYSDKAWNLFDKKVTNPGKNLKDHKNPYYYENTIEELKKKPHERKDNAQFANSFNAMANRSSEAIKFLSYCMDNNKTDEVIAVLRLNEFILPAYMIATTKEYLSEKKQDIGSIVDEQK